MIPENMIKSLDTLAGVKPEDYKVTERSVEFKFNNSLIANNCKIVSYHNNYIVEFRKISNSLVEGFSNKLVSETVIKPGDLTEHFENKTGIYLSFLGL